MGVGGGGEEFLEDDLAEEHTTYSLRRVARSDVTEGVWKAVEKRLG